MASAGTLIFELAADVSRLRTDMSKAQTEIKSSLDSIAKATSASAIMAGADYALEFAKSFADKIKQAIDNADALGKLSQAVGTSVESLSALQYAGEFAGVSTEDLGNAFKGLTNSLVDATNPLSKSALAIKALGLDVKTLQSEDPGKAFDDIAEAMTKFADGTDKSAIAMQLFGGRVGQKLIPLLNEGSEGLAEARKEAEQLGLVISGSTAKAMADLNDDLTRLSKVSEGAFAVIAQNLTPALDTLVKTFSDAATDGSSFNTVLKFIGTTVSDLILDLVELAGEIRIAWTELQGYGTAVKQFFSGDFKDAINTARDSMKQSNEQLGVLLEQTQKAKALQRDLQDHPLDFGNEKEGWDPKPPANYLATVAEGSKKAKKAVDDYGTMLKSLQEQLRTTVAEGDAMTLLLTDPKFVKFTSDQQQALIGLTQANIDAKNAIQARADAQANAQSADEFEAANAKKRLQDELDQADALWALGDAYTAAVDPTVAYNKTLAELNATLAAGAISQDTYNANIKIAAQTLKDAQENMDPLKKQTKELTQAIDAFGKKSSDAFVDFIFNTGDASKSFGEMITSMLEDLAKMLVYKNVFEPLFNGISSGVSGGWASLVSGLVGGGGAARRMAGGPVLPGTTYRVNESALKSEYFVPNVPGHVTTSDQASSGAVEVTVNINKYGATTSDVSGDSATDIELGKRISAVVRQVIATEKRTGGLLAS